MHVFPVIDDVYMGMRVSVFQGRDKLPIVVLRELSSFIE